MIQIESTESYEASTLGGLVSEIEGRIPLAGEVVMLEHAGLRMEVVASTDRRVDRLRVFPPSSRRRYRQLTQMRVAAGNSAASAFATEIAVHLIMEREDPLEIWICCHSRPA